jgi:hypothetical protein
VGGIWHVGLQQYDLMFVAKGFECVVFHERYFGFLMTCFGLEAWVECACQLLCCYIVQKFLKTEQHSRSFCKPST